MGIIPIADRTWRLHVINNFSGGMAMPPRDDTEASLIDNFYITRSGSLISRPGLKKYNSTDLGTDVTVGLGIGALGAVRKTLFVFKKGTRVFHVTTSGNVPTTFSEISGPDTGYNPVMMEPVEGSSGVYYTIFACPHWTGLYEFHDDAPALTALSKITDSPSGFQYIKLAGQRMYTAGNPSKPYAVRFSDAGDPLSWPTANEFSVPASRGRITGLERQAGVLLIFTERAVLQLQGDPPSNFKLLTVHENIGALHPMSLGTVGAVTAFLSDYGFMYVSGGVEAFGEKLDGSRDIPRASEASHPSNVFIWGALTPDYYACRVRSLNPDPDVGYIVNHEVWSGRDEKMYLFDRNRFRSWVRLVYPPSAVPDSLGYRNARFCPILWLPEVNGIIMAGGNGDLYLQTLQLYFDEWEREDSTDHPDIPVISRLVSRYYTFGDMAMVKQWRRAAVTGFGHISNLNLDTIGGHSSSRYIYPLGSGPLPFQKDSPELDIRTSLFSAVRLDLSGTNMQVMGVDLSWRPARVSVRKHT